MSYIRLNQSNIKYSTNISSTIIVSEIVNSSLSYKSPILINSKDMLDIYFGRSFKNRDYYDELLKSGVSLLLYKPISINKNTTSEDYINLLEYTNDEVIYATEEDFPNVGEDKVIYTLASSEEFIWITPGNYYVNIKYLNQNLNNPENYTSWTNRDTLRIFNDSELGFDHCYPKYPWNSEYLDDTSTQEVLDSLKENGVDGLDDEYETLSFSIDFTKVESFYSEIGNRAFYFVLPNITTGLNYMIWYKRNDYESESIPVGGDFIGGDSAFINLINQETNEAYSRDELIQFTKENLLEAGYNISTVGDKFIVYLSRKGTNSYFYEFPGLTIESNFNISQDILSKATNPYKRIEFFSKTIGKAEDGENIKIKIEKVNHFKERYRVIVSRYNYIETHEGNLFSDPDKNGNISTIDSIINKDSLLIECKLYKDGYSINGSNPGLPEGTWELRRGEIEEVNPNMYWNSLKLLSDCDIIEDFLLIPDINEFIVDGIKEDYDWYTEYQDLDNYAKSRNCQVLITNTDSKFKIEEVSELPTSLESNVVYKIEGNSDYWALINGLVTNVSNNRELTNPYSNNFIFNWTGDEDNRLVYFFRNMEAVTYDRPGYYIFLRGILSDTYSISTKQILYKSPISDQYISNESIEDLLESKKSNYLVDNNQLYYYKKYLNHPGNGDYNTTILTRFCISKLSRELNNNKWNIIGNQLITRKKEEIYRIINTLRSRYSIIKDIIIDSIEIINEESNMNINLKLYISELLDKDINLSVTLNYIN